MEQVSLLDHELRCGYCFQYKEDIVCMHCQGEPRFCDYKAACFEMSPPVANLIRRMKKDCPFLASSMAAYLLLQFQDIGWPTPDYVTYVPNYLTFTYLPLPSSIKQVAQDFAKLLGVPLLHNALEKRQPSLRQENLSLSQRHLLPLDTFSLRVNAPSISGKKILIIDDFMVTGKTLESCAYALLEGNPQRIYGLTISISDLS